LAAISSSEKRPLSFRRASRAKTRFVAFRSRSVSISSSRLSMSFIATPSGVV
jgi:hypothetical protein